jgi:hypothetical protein
VNVTEFVVFIGPSVLLLGVLALILLAALRRRPFWRTAAVTSVLIGMVLGPALWLLRSGPYWLYQLLQFLAWPISTFVQPLIGDTDPVVLIPFVPLLLAIEIAAIVFAVFCVARLVSRLTKASSGRRKVVST